MVLPPIPPQCSTHCLQPPLPSTGWEEAPPLVSSWKSPVQRGCNYKGESYISGQCLHPASKQCFPRGDSVLTILVLSQAAAGRLRAKSWRGKAATNASFLSGLCTSKDTPGIPQPSPSFSSPLATPDTKHGAQKAHPRAKAPCSQQTASPGHPAMATVGMMALACCWGRSSWNSCIPLAGREQSIPPAQLLTDHRQCSDAGLH